MARYVAAAGCRPAHLARAAREVRRGLRSVFRPWRQDSGRGPERAEAQVRGAGASDLEGRSDGGVLLQLPPGALRPHLRHPHPGRQHRQYGLPGIRPGAHRHGALQDPRLQAGELAERGRPEALALSTAAGAIDGLAAIKGLDASTYTRDVLHAESCAWVEKNCYVDIWIEVVHALGLETRAMLPFVAAIDFEGDQWTFFKPPHGELRELYGIDVQELNVWRPLLEHAQEYLCAGKLISTEADAFWLPDTSGTDYRRQHTKSTIVLNDLDLPNRRLGYFHNAGYYQLEGEDFARTFRLDLPPDPTFMPLFAEVVRV